MARPRKWTDEDLIREVPHATSIKDLLRRLGVTHGGWTYLTIRERLRALEVVDALHLLDPRPEEPLAGVDDDMIRKAVEDACTMPEVLRRLPVDASMEVYAAVKERMHQLGLPPPHGGNRRSRYPSMRALRDRPGGWTVDELKESVAASESVRASIRALGFPDTSANRRHFAELVEELDLDTSHFLGQAIFRGKKRPGRYWYALQDILVQHSTYLNTHNLRVRLIDEGVKEERCEVCQRTEWNGEPIPLQLDHINGDRRDNRLENLRIVCPNCHAQTDTWCGKNRGRYDDVS